MYTPSATHSSDNSRYWPLLRNISVEEKLRLIARLSDSVATLLAKPKENEKDHTARFIAKYNGAWKGTASSEDILIAIRADRSSRAPISFD